MTDQSLVARCVAELQVGVHAAPSHLQRVGTPSHPRELEYPEHRIVGFRWSGIGRPSPWGMRRDGESVEVQGRYVLSVDDGNACPAAGVGLTR